MIKKLIPILCLVPAISIADDSFNSTTEILHMPVVSVGSEKFEVDMLHQGDYVFKVTSVMPAPLQSIPDTYDPDTYDPDTGIVHMPRVVVGSEYFEVEMIHQGDLVFQVTSAVPIEAKKTLEFTTELLSGRTFYTVIKNSSGGETCILEATYTSSTVSQKEWVYHNDESWSQGCQEDFGEYNNSSYSINNGILQWDLGEEWPSQLNEISEDSYTVTDPDGSYAWYFSKEKVNSVSKDIPSNINPNSPTSTNLKFSTEWLNGKTLYNVYTDYDNENSGSASGLAGVTFKFTASDFTADSGIVDNPELVSGNYIIDDNGYLLFSDSDGSSEAISILNVNSERLTLCWRESVSDLNDSCSNQNSENQEYFYFDKVKAEEKLL